MSEISSILKQRIAQMAEINNTANADLTAHMEKMRDGITRQQAVYGGTSTPITPGELGATQEYLHKRLQLQGSSWASEVIAAGALDADFQKEVGNKARQILIANGMYPKDDTEPTPSSTEESDEATT